MSGIISKLKKAPLFIEFVGMPGSGKTTLSHRAAEVLREKGTTVLEPTYFINNEKLPIQRYLIKLWYLIKLAWLRPAWALKWFFLVVQSGQKTLIDFVSMIINCFFILEIYRYYGRYNDICFLDQGICQAIVSLSYNSKTENFIDRKIVTATDLFPTLGFQIIHIKTDVDSIVQRLKTRQEKQSRLELKKNAADFIDKIRDEERKIDNMLKIMCTQLQADITIIQIGSSEDIHSAAKQIADLVADR